MGGCEAEPECKYRMENTEGKKIGGKSFVNEFVKICSVFVLYSPPQDSTIILRPPVREGEFYSCCIGSLARRSGVRVEM